METGKTARYFLGANSGYGFYSLYDGFVDLRGGDFLWIIKGGPGCGKSSFMKRIGKAAEQAGQSVEYIFCSGDPDSLDGLWLPEKRTGYVDGTAPHALEATFPGSASLYLDLGAFYDAGALEKEHEQICGINSAYKALYSRAYELLSAYTLISPKTEGLLWGEAEKAKMSRRISGLAAREFRKSHGSGKIKTRFLSAFTCRGRVFMQETVQSLCKRVCMLDNALGLAGYYLSTLAKAAADMRLELVLCPNPIDPNRLEAVLLPELELGFIAVEPGFEYTGEIWRHIRLDSLPEQGRVSAARAQLRLCRKLGAQTLLGAEMLLSQAKQLHDELEAIYNPHVDFDGLYAAADDHISWLFSGSPG